PARRREDNSPKRDVHLSRRRGPSGNNAPPATGPPAPRRRRIVSTQRNVLGRHSEGIARNPGRAERATRLLAGPPNCCRSSRVSDVTRSSDDHRDAEWYFEFREDDQCLVIDFEAGRPGVAAVAAEYVHGQALLQALQIGDVRPDDTPECLQ